jgi:hypothetical protein
MEHSQQLFDNTDEVQPFDMFKYQKTAPEYHIPFNECVLDDDYFSDDDDYEDDMYFYREAYRMKRFFTFQQSEKYRPRTQKEYYYGKMEFYIDNAFNSIFSSFLYNIFPENAEYFISKQQRSQTRCLEQTILIKDLITELIEDNIDFQLFSIKIIQLIKTKIFKTFSNLTHTKFETDEITGTIVDSKVVVCQMTTNIITQIDVIINVYLLSHPIPTL